jgi:hypothetical protein
MKALFGSLLCLVFTLGQSFALGGGPNYGGPRVTTTGISFNTAHAVPRAAVGVAAGDLPGTGNPNGFTQPVAIWMPCPRRRS